MKVVDLIEFVFLLALLVHVHSFHAMTEEAESSSRALERYLTRQLAQLSLTVPDEEVEFMARFIEEEMEPDDKVEGVKGMLEGVVEGVSDRMPLPAS